MPYTLGVDLGTTWTAAAVASGGEPKPLTLGGRGFTMPSVVAREGEGFVVGEAAERRMRAAPHTGAREMKRRLGDPAPFVVDGTPYGAEALMAQLLAHAIAVTEESEGEPPATVVLTHPATWGPYKLDLLLEAARVAGVTGEVVLLSEPEAAASHYANLGRVGPGETVAVYDFGGGTFDAAILRRTENGFELLGEAQGLERLGGIDLDQAVLAHVDRALGESLQELDRADPAVREGLLRLRGECTAAKEALSDDTDAAISVALPGLSTQVRLTREELEAMIRPRLAETTGALRSAVSSAGIALDDLSAVLLVGGTSRIPLIAEFVTADTGRPVVTDAHPKLVVALGASSHNAVAIDETDTTSPPVSPAGVAAVAVAQQSTEQAQEMVAVTAKDTDTHPAPSEADEPREHATEADVAAAGRDTARKQRARQQRNLAVGGAVAGTAAAAGAAAFALQDDAGAAEADADPAAGDAAAVAPEDDPAVGTAPDDEAAGAEAAGVAGSTRAGARPSMDAFDEVSGTAPRARSGGVGAAGATSSPAADPVANRAGSFEPGRPAPAGDAMSQPGTDHAPDDPAPMPRSGPAPTGTPAPPAPAPAPGAPANDLEGFRAAMRARLETWQPPAGADPADVDKLLDDLEGLIDRAQPLPGQSVEDAIEALQYAVEDRIERFVTTERLDAEDERKQAAQEAAAERAAQTAEERAEFETFKGGLDEYINQFVERDFGDNEKALAKLIEAATSRQHDPRVPLRDQELRLKDFVDDQLRDMRDRRLDNWYRAEEQRARQEYANPEDAEYLEQRLAQLRAIREAAQKAPVVPPEAEDGLEATIEPPFLEGTLEADKLDLDLVQAGAATMTKPTTAEDMVVDAFDADVLAGPAVAAASSAAASAVASAADADVDTLGVAAVTAAVQAVQQPATTGVDVAAAQVAPAAVDPGFDAVLAVSDPLADATAGPDPTTLPPPLQPPPELLSDEPDEDDLSGSDPFADDDVLGT